MTLRRESSQSFAENLGQQNRRAIFWVIFLFAFLLLALGAIAIYVYTAQINQLAAEGQKDLKTIYEAKIESISNWRQERLGDALIISTNTLMQDAVKHLMENPGDASDQEVLAGWLATFLEAYDYESYQLVDTNGEVILASSAVTSDRPPEILAVMQLALKEDRVILTDMYQSQPSAGIFLDLLIPIEDPASTLSTPNALCIMRIDPYDFLYPMIQAWPVLSKSGETVLFRQDGAHVTYLNSLRFNPDSALKYQFPTDDPDLPAARIIRGDNSIGEGVDYRGVQVFYGGEQIPDTDWYLLAKIDRDEVFKDVRRQGWVLAIVLLLLLTADLSLAYALIHRQRAMYTNELLDLEKNREEISERYSALFDGGNDIIFLVDEQGNITDSNDRAQDAYGYTEKELARTHLMDLRVAQFRQPVKEYLENVKSKGSLRVELEHQRKDGTVFPVEISIRHFAMNGKDFFLSITRDISERKASQIALEMSEARYRGIIEHATDGIFTADREARFTSVNDVGCRMLGYSHEEIIGKKVFDLIAPESLTAEPIHFWEVASGEKTFVVTEREVIKKDGSRLPVEISTFLLPEGRVQGVVRDISERIHYRQELEAALEQYQSLFNQNPIPSHVHNEKTGRVLAVNEAALKLYGYSREEFLAMKIDRLESGEKQDKEEKGIQNPPLHHHRKKDGSVVSVEITSHKVDFNGQPSVMVLEVDVTDRQRIEKALKENLYDLQSIVDTSPLAMITTDKNGVVTLWNNAAEQIFGWRAEEVIGKELAYFPSDKEENLSSVLQQAFDSKEALVYETVRSHKNGRHLNVRVHALAIRDYKDEIKGILAIISDETEFKLIEAANLAMQEERNSLLHRLQLQFKNMPVGFLLTDENLNVIDWNPAAETIFGYSREEIIGKSEFSTIIPEDQKQSVQNVIRRTIKHNLTIVSRNENLRKDGRRITVEWHNTPLRDESGELIAMMNMALDVTEKVEAENRLRESEEKLRGFFESNLIGIIWANLEGQIYTANDAFLDLIGYSHQDMEAGLVNWEKLTPVEFTESDKISIEIARREGTCPPYEKQYLRKDGTPIWVLIGFVIIGDKKDQSISFALDISERKKAEHALAESEIRYSSLFKNMLNGIAACKMIYDETGRAIDYINLRVNDTFEKLTGLSGIEGKRITEAIPGIREDNPELFETYGRVASTGNPESFETFVPGLGIYYSIHVYSPEQDYFTVVFDDITSRKKAELEIRSKQELLNLTGSIAKVGGWEFDVKTGKVTWTDEVARIHDLTPSDPVRIEFGLDFYHGENRARIEQAVNAAVEKGIPYDLQLEIVSAKGVVKNVRTVGFPEYSDDQVDKVRGIFQDITELKKAEAEVKALNESLEQRVRDRTEELQIANQELEAFTYSVSHDLRAPVRAIDGFSQIVIDEYSEGTSPDVLRYLALIRKNTQNMGHLVDDLLAFSRLGKQPINKSTINLTRLVKDVVAGIKSQESGRKIKFSIEKIPACEADETLLKQVYVNLISNAVKFTRSRNPAVIEMGICNACPRCSDGSPGKETRCYYVKDNGVGFDMRYYDKLFGVFQRLHSTEEYEGTGVGLAIVQRVIEKHGGTIWAESAIDSGTTFYFTLGKEKNDDKPN